MHMTRRQSLAALAGSAGLLVGSPHFLARAASLPGARPAISSGMARTAGLDFRAPAALAFLREMGSIPWRSPGQKR